MMTVDRKIYKIDAKGKVLGRLATEVARLLQGKNKPDYLPNKDNSDVVEVSNINQLKFGTKKLEQKTYYHHTGYLGNLKAVSLEKVFSQRPKEVLRKAVWNMLPKNKLRAKRIKRVIFK